MKFLAQGKGLWLDKTEVEQPKETKSGVTFEIDISVKDCFYALNFVS
jgi:hypothetical protein